ncbi:MAG: CBS domain-containing protein [Planctomycetaceae bacterium]|nr:CBS domain-containing protein [Planctomycetaceae bacterium]
MSTDVIAAPRQTSIADAERLLLTSGVDELFVIDERGALCGVVPDYELLKLRFVPILASQTVESVMSRRFLVIGPESSLAVAGRYLREHIHRRLAVVEGRRLIGQITRRAVLTQLAAFKESSHDTELDRWHAEGLLHRVHGGASPSRATMPRDSVAVLPGLVDARPVPAM